MVRLRDQNIPEKIAERDEPYCLHQWVSGSEVVQGPGGVLTSTPGLVPAFLWIHKCGNAPENLTIFSNTSNHF